MGAASDSSAMEPYAAILVVILLALGITALIAILTAIVGPRRKGPVKDSPYESGVPPIGDARGRFHVRFYLVAMLFLLFDVEVVFLWPWAPVFHDAAVNGRTITLAGGMTIGREFLLAEVAVFLLILLVGYIYAWRKGVFRWD